RHGLGTLVNGLIESGFVVEHLSELVDVHPDPTAEPGTWDHFVSVAPPWLSFWLKRGQGGHRRWQGSLTGAPGAFC
ncbi:MAG TPA: hypothetical protein VIO35_10040, partial [Chloroflexota bacterium]